MDSVPINQRIRDIIWLPKYKSFLMFGETHPQLILLSTTTVLNEFSKLERHKAVKNSLRKYFANRPKQAMHHRELQEILEILGLTGKEASTFSKQLIEEGVVSRPSWRDKIRELLK